MLASRLTRLEGRAAKIAAGIKPGVDPVLIRRKFAELAGMLGRETAMSILERRGVGDVVDSALQTAYTERRR